MGSCVYRLITNYTNGKFNPSFFLRGGGGSLCKYDRKHQCIPQLKWSWEIKNPPKLNERPHKYKIGLSEGNHKEIPFRQSFFKKRQNYTLIKLKRK